MCHTYPQKPGPAGEAGDLCCGVLEGLPTIGASCSMCSQMAGQHLREGECESQLLSLTPEAAAAATKGTVCKYRFCPCLPGRLCSPPLPRVLQSGAYFPRRIHSMPQALELHTSFCHHRNSLHILIVTAVSLPLPSLSEQVSPSQPLLSPPSCLGGERTPEDSPHTEEGPKPKLNPRAVRPKKRKGNLSMQLQEQQIKS